MCFYYSIEKAPDRQESAEGEKGGNYEKSAPQVR